MVLFFGIGGGGSGCRVADAVASVASTLADLRKALQVSGTFTGGPAPSYAAAPPQFPQAQAKRAALDGALRLARKAK